MQHCTLRSVTCTSAGNSLTYITNALWRPDYPKCPVRPDYSDPNPPHIAPSRLKTDTLFYVSQQDSDSLQKPPSPTGRAFCFLPLPVKTGLPVHVNGFFELSSNRRDVWHGGDMYVKGLSQIQAHCFISQLVTVVHTSRYTRPDEGTVVTSALTVCPYIAIYSS